MDDLRAEFEKQFPAARTATANNWISNIMFEAWRAGMASVVIHLPSLVGYPPASRGMAQPIIDKYLEAIKASGATVSMPHDGVDG